MINENKTRIVAALQLTIIGSYLFMGYVDILFILVHDFFVRLYLTALISPVELIATGIVSLFTRKKYNEYTSDKEFATHMALIIVSVSLAAELLGYTKLALFFILLLVVWKTLEATKNICLGCKLYELLRRKGIEIVSL